MNLDTRARDAAASLRAAAPADLEDGLRRLHRTRQRRTAGKVAAALSVVAVALGAVQLGTGRDRALPPVSPPPHGVLVSGGDAGADWAAQLAGEGVQTYPRFRSADPLTRRFLVVDRDVDPTRLSVMTPGRDEPLATIPCGPCFYTVLGPGPDELTMLNDEFELVVVGHDGRQRRSLGRAPMRRDGVNGYVDRFAWSPDRTTLAFVRVEEAEGGKASLVLELHRPESGETTTLHRQTEAAPDGHDPDHADGGGIIPGWGSPRLHDVQWAPDSARVAFTLHTLAGSAANAMTAADVYRLRLFVADTMTGAVTEVRDLGTCHRADGHPACLEPYVAWAPDGASLTVLTDDHNSLTRLDLTGNVLHTEPARGRGPLVWLEPR